MITIRNSTISDIEQLALIDKFYIENSNITFDVQLKTPEQRDQWFAKFKNTGPYRLFVASEDGKVLGYCSSNRYREHSAFERTIETSIYLAPDCRSKGIGTLLYKKLFEELAEEPLHLAVSGIALPNDASIRLHKKFGFTEVGIFSEYAIKNGNFISSIWLQKRLGS